MKTLSLFFLICLLKSWEGLALSKQTEANHFFKLLADIKVVLQLALLNEPWIAFVEKENSQNKDWMKAKNGENDVLFEFDTDTLKRLCVKRTFCAFNETTWRSAIIHQSVFNRLDIKCLLRWWILPIITTDFLFYWYHHTYTTKQDSTFVF